jgi:transposase-like protein
MAKDQGQVGENKSAVVKSMPMACSNEDAAVELMEQLCWGENPFCSHCGDTNVYKMMDSKTGKRNKDYRWRCNGCKKMFTVRMNTVMESSRIPLRHWCYAFWAACSSKKGVSALQIKRMTGLTYKSALFLMHRIRESMTTNSTPMTGIVEADETYIGGKPRKGTGKHKRGRGIKKTPVFGIVERNGRVKSQVIASVNAANLKGAILELVDRNAHVMTDENPCYNGLGNDFAGHSSVCHSANEFVRNGIHTNTMESAWALLKRGIYGVFHNVSKKHLHRYLSEFDFRYNTRKVDDGERVRAAVRNGVGRRLAYQDLISTPI